MVYLCSHKRNDYFYEPTTNYIYYVDVRNIHVDDKACSSKWLHYIDSEVESLSDIDKQLPFPIPVRRDKIVFDDVDDDYQEEYVYRKFDNIIEKLIFEKL